MKQFITLLLFLSLTSCKTTEYFIESNPRGVTFTGTAQVECDNQTDSTVVFEIKNTATDSIEKVVVLEANTKLFFELPSSKKDVTVENEYLNSLPFVRGKNSIIYEKRTN